MGFIVTLHRYKKEGKSIRKLLDKFGIKQWGMFTEHLCRMNQEEAIALLLNWISENVNKEEKIKVRIIEEDTRDVYELRLKSHQGCLRVASIIPHDDLKGKLLYHWPSGAMYSNFTINMLKEAWTLQTL